jgi:hypothetical protein
MKEINGIVMVTGRGGTAFTGPLTQKVNGDIVVCRNAPTWLSDSNCLIVIDAIKKRATSVAIDGEVLKIETIWQKVHKRC